MKVSFTELAWSDYLWLQKGDKRLLKRVNLLIKDVMRDAFEGIGKPEPLNKNSDAFSHLAERQVGVKEPPNSKPWGIIPLW
ncbi:MAG: type II toxin-antitoxin system YoeB family toxin [Phormidium sp. PBR-2020]|nr:MAG: type II toxin-antitoxin system YoeB family toxin [Phormidium sp. PBR-2020]